MVVHPKSIEAYKLLHEGTLALARAEQQGVRIDLEYTEAKKEEITNKIEELENEFMSTNLYKHWKHTTGRRSVNIYSNQQLAHFLYKTKKLDPLKETASGLGSTSEEALSQLEVPELELLVRARKLKKVRDTYLDAFLREQVNGYIHPLFNLHLVTTFRSSCDRPNFQNIPKRDEEAMQITRRALFPRPGHQLIEIDFKSLEVRIAACYHKDPSMLRYIEDPTTDMHRDLAVQIFLIDKFNKGNSAHAYLRNAAKNGFVFPQFFGDYYKNCAGYMAQLWGKLPKSKWKKGQGYALKDNYFLADHLIEKGINSYNDFVDHVRDIEDHFWTNRFIEFKRWKKVWWQKYQKNGYVDMFTGFRCGGVLSQNDAINYPVQGAAFHCLLWSLIQMDRRIIEKKWDTRIIGQIHDAIVLDVNPKELNIVAETLRRIMCEDIREAWPWIVTPLDVDFELSPVDKSWAEKKPYEH
jgi:DNA polymerase I